MLAPLEADILTALPGIRHGFFTRQGGVSRGIYKSLNCGQGSRDDEVAVLENRTRVATHLGVPSGEVQTLYQAHTAEALIVDRLLPREDLPRADALVTRTRGLAVGVLTADCTPVLFADAEAGVVGAAHAGWRGAQAGILEATLAAMETAGASRARIHAAIGPAIGRRFYEVGPEFEAGFLAADPESARYFVKGTDGGRAHFDLPAYVGHRLEAASVRSVEMRAHCTYENESLFFSFRRSQHRSEADYGRQISAIVVA